MNLVTLLLLVPGSYAIDTGVIDLGGGESASFCGQLVSGAAFIVASVGTAWIRWRRTQRILGSELPRAPATLPDIPVDRASPAIAARLLSHEVEPDLRALRAHGVDAAALAETLWGAWQRALDTHAEPDLPLSEGASAAWKHRLGRAPAGATVGLPRLLQVVVSGTWILVDFEVVTCLREGDRDVEWTDRVRLRAGEAPHRWELLSVEDEYRGPPRPFRAAPPRRAPRPDWPSAHPAPRAAVERALAVVTGDAAEDEAVAPSLAAELRQRRARGWAPPTGLRLVDVLVGDRGEVWIEAESGGRVAERWRLGERDGAWRVLGPG